MQRRKVALISADFSVLTTWATIFWLYEEVSKEVFNEKNEEIV
jgi:hypothetical protein